MLFIHLRRKFHIPGVYVDDSYVQRKANKEFLQNIKNWDLQSTQ